MFGIPFFPPEASTIAGHVDALMFFVFSVAVVFATLIAGLIVIFAVKYHHRSQADRTNPVNNSLAIELIWTGIPLAIVLTMFVLGAREFIEMHEPPPNAAEVYVVGKQWMWKIQHSEGQREINELHIPVGQPIKLLMISQDVIHSFFVPAFRMKQDVLPGRYTSEWFEATVPGTYHLFCAQYCGTSHSAMIGKVIAMTPPDYERWLEGTVSGSMAQAGEKAFHQYGCISCHRADSLRRAPVLDGLFGKVVHLEGGQQVTADEAYIRESILKPRAKIVEGYQPIMPTYEGQISEDQVQELIAYIKSLKGP